MLISPISHDEDDNQCCTGWCHRHQSIALLSRPSHVIRKWWRPHRVSQSSWHWAIKRRCHLMSQQHKVTKSMSSQLSTFCRCYYYFISLQGLGHHVTTSLTWLVTSPENNCIINNDWVRYRPTNASRVSRKGKQNSRNSIKICLTFKPLQVSYSDVFLKFSLDSTIFSHETR